MTVLQSEKAENIKAALDVVCGKWKAVILMELLGQTLRFSELEKRLPQVNHQSLIKHLKELERDGLIERKAFPVVPPRVEYSLTDYGESTESLLDALEIWGSTHKKRVESHQ